MGGKLKLLLTALLSLLLSSFLAATILFNYTGIVDQKVRDLANHFSGDGWQIHFDDLSGSLFGTVYADDLSIISDKDTILVRRAELDYSLLDIVANRYIIDDLVLIDPVVHLDQSEPDSADLHEDPFMLDSLVADIVANLPDIKVNRLIVDDGQVQLKLANSVEQIGDIQMELSAQVDDEKVEIRPRYMRAKWLNRNIIMEDLSFRLLGNKKRITLNQLQARIPDLELVGHGEVEFEPEFRILAFMDTSRIEVDLLRKFAPDLPFESGYLKCYGSYIGTLARFGGEAYVKGEMDELVIEQLSTRYRRDGVGYKLEDMKLSSNAGKGEGSLYLSRFGKNAIDISVDDLALDRAGLIEERFQLDGRLRFDLDNWRGNETNGKGTLELRNVHYGNMMMDMMFLNARVDDGNWQFTEPSKAHFGEGAEFQFAGTVDKNMIADLTLRSESNNLDTLFHRLGMTDMGGQASMELDLSGPLADPSIVGFLFMDSLYSGQSMVYAVDGGFRIDNLIKNRRGNFDLDMATGYIGNVFLTSGAARFGFLGNRIIVEPLQFFSEENSIELRGSVAFIDSSIDIAASKLQVAYNDYVISNSDSLTARWSADTLKVGNFRLVTSDSGLIAAEGFVAPNASSALFTDVVQIRVEPLNQYLYWDHRMAGILNAEFEFVGEMENPEYNLFLDLKDFSVNDNFLGKIDGDFVMANGQLGINYFNFERDSSSYLTVNGSFEAQIDSSKGNAAGLEDAPLDMNIVAENLRLEDYKFLYETNLPVSGRLSGRLDLAGTLGEPLGNLELSGTTLRYGDYRIPKFSTESWLNNSIFELREADVDFLDTDVKLTGEMPVNWDIRDLSKLLEGSRFRIRATVDEDSLNFLNAVNAELDRLTGDIRAFAVLEGDFENFQLVEGNVIVDDGKLYLSRLENSIDDLKLTATLNDYIMTIEDMTAISPKRQYDQNFFQRWFNKIQNLLIPTKESGEIRGSGTIDFSDALRPKMDLELAFNKAYFNYFLENAQFLASSNNMTISGRDTLSIGGDIDVHWGDMELDFIESEKNLLLSTNVREDPPFLQYNLDVTLLPNFHVRSADVLNNFQIKMGGELSVLQEPRSLLEMYGILQVQDGKYFVQGEEFDIETGTIDFVKSQGIAGAEFVCANPQAYRCR